ncbi:MAG: collagen-like protein, partial [Crocinitomicaceae bacterium]|nr:collagen-like protein [Crocinitomicaceae bacterium]
MIFGALSLVGQAPNKMSYQAVIRDASGNLVINSVVSMKVSLLQGSATGTVVFQELHSSSTNSNGLYSVIIGSGTNLTGNIASVNWANGPFYIKTETDPNGGLNYNIVGTTQLLSVPYALYAATSGNGPAGPAGP